MQHWRRYDRYRSDEDFAGRAVQRDHVPLAHLEPPARAILLDRVDVKSLSPRHTRPAHPAGDHGSVRRPATPAGEHACGGDHALEVLRARLTPDQDCPLAHGGPRDRRCRVEGGPAYRRTRRGGRAPDQERTRRRRVELGEGELGQLSTADSLQALVQRDQALVDQLGGNAERGRRGALAYAGLEQPQLAPLHRELDVAQVAVMGLEPAHGAAQVAVRNRVELGEIFKRHGIADPRHYVFSLRVGQVVPVGPRAARRWVTREAHPRP